MLTFAHSDDSMTHRNGRYVVLAEEAQDDLSESLELYESAIEAGQYLQMTIRHYPTGICKARGRGGEGVCRSAAPPSNGRSAEGAIISVSSRGLW